MDMNAPTNPPLEQTLAMAQVVHDLTAIAVRQVQGRVGEAPRRRRGTTLRPGSAPLWREVVKQARPYLSRRGSKVALARILAVPPQRINDYFVSEKAFPDAERCLLILCWLGAQKEGRDVFAEAVVTR